MNENRPIPTAGGWPGALFVAVLLTWNVHSTHCLAALATCKEPTVTAGNPSGDPVPDDESLTVVSMNLHGAQHWALVRRELTAALPLAKSDIFLIQEIKANGPSLLDAAARELGFHYLFTPNEDWGLAILSRFPLRNPRATLLPQNDLKYRSRCRIALSAVAATDSGPLHLFNVHLDTRINASRRVRQVRPVMKAAQQAPGPSLIGGDFNTANVLWIQSVVPIPFLQCQERAVRKAMKKIGFTTPFGKGATLDFPPGRLDWIFLRGVRSTENGLVPLGFSDHKALWTVIDVTASGPASCTDPG